MTTGNNITNETESNLVKVVRGLVRPIVTFLVVLALVIIVVYLIIKFADVDLAKSILGGFIALVSSIVGFWFGSRKTGGAG